MSARDRGSGRRGRGRGRPSLLDVLRRPDPAPAADEEALVPAEARRGDVLARASSSATAISLVVPSDVVPDPLRPLPPLPSQSLAKFAFDFAEAGRIDETAQDEETVTFAKELWSPASNVWAATSTSARVAATGQGRHWLQNSERRLCAAAELVERARHGQLQSALSTMPPGTRLLAFVEHARYDEAIALLSVRQGVEGILQLTHEGMEPPPGACMTMQTTEAVPARVFQTLHAWGALVAVPKEGGASEYVVVTSDCVASSQILQRTDAATFAQALLHQSVCRPAAVSGFKLRLRLTCNDRLASQALGERMLCDTRHGWQRLSIACEIHKSTACQAKAFQLMPEAVTGFVRFSLSLRLGGWMKLFRKCLRQEVLETLVVREGRSSSAAAEYRRKAVSAFMSVGEARRHRHAIIAMLPNGNWLNHEVVEVFVADGSTWQKEEVASLVAVGLCAALAASRFKVFNRSRWTQNDEAIGQLGLAQACHGLLCRTYMRWLRTLGSTVFGRVLTPMEPTPVGDADGAGVTGANLQEDVGEAPGQSGETDEPDFAKQNEVTRSLAADWVTGEAFRDLVLARQTMEPTMAVLRRQLWISSAKWEKEQHARCVGGDPASHRDREYRILISARGEMDESFRKHQSVLFDRADIWSLLPEHTMTESTKCLAFRMASRAGAEFERLLSRPHGKPPFTLFLALEQERLVRELKEMHRLKPCLLDPFSLRCLSNWDLATEEAQLALLLILQMGTVDTAEVECTHAWLRRIAVRLGAQAKRPDFLDVAARGFAQRVKKRRAAQEVWLAHPAPLTSQLALTSVASSSCGPQENNNRRRGEGEHGGHSSVLA